VKHASGITLLLSGHKAGTPCPVYHSGSLISGMVVLSKPSSVTSLEVKLEGYTSVREIQGGGRSSIVFYSDQLIAWDATGASLPDEFSFRRIVPIYSHNGRLLPPSFDSRLSAIPGFRVSVNWSISIRITRKRTSPLSVFRRIARLAVPIVYLPRTRPPMPGPFPISSTHSSPSQPRTSFVDLVPSRKEHIIPIHTQIYLPNSQITPMTEVISFRIVLSAPEMYLKPFLALPSHSPFLPLGNAASPASEPSSRPATVQLVRRIGADPRETFVVVVGELTTSTARGSILAEALLSTPELGQDSVSWWGQLCVPLGLASPGGFVADRLAVQDVLVLTLNAPSMTNSHMFPFRQAVPIRLTTDLPGASDALPVTEV